MNERDTAAGLLDAPWPPVYPKQPGEPPGWRRAGPRRPDQAGDRVIGPSNCIAHHDAKMLNAGMRTTIDFLMIFTLRPLRSPGIHISR